MSINDDCRNNATSAADNPGETRLSNKPSVLSITLIVIPRQDAPVDAIQGLVNEMLLSVFVFHSMAVWLQLCDC